MPALPLLGAGFVVLWIIILGVYLRSSRQQVDLERKLDQLERSLQTKELESQHEQ